MTAKFFYLAVGIGIAIAGQFNDLTMVDAWQGDAVLRLAGRS